MAIVHFHSSGEPCNERCSHVTKAGPVSVVDDRKRRQILEEIERQQDIQSTNPPDSPAWKKASKRLHELITELTGKAPKDACGRR